MKLRMRMLFFDQWKVQLDLRRLIHQRALEGVVRSTAVKKNGRLKWNQNTF